MKQCTSLEPAEVAHIDKLSLDNRFADAGFSQQQCTWGDIRVFAITSQEKVSVLDEASLRDFVRFVFDKALHCNQQHADIEERAKASAATRSADPMEGTGMSDMHACMHAPFANASCISAVDVCWLPLLAAFDWELPCLNAGGILGKRGRDEIVQEKAEEPSSSGFAAILAQMDADAAARPQDMRTDEEREAEWNEYLADANNPASPEYYSREHGDTEEYEEHEDAYGQEEADSDDM